MSIHNAAAIVGRLGPCRIALDLTAHGRLAQELALLGCELHAPPSADAAGGASDVGYVEWPRLGVTETLADAIRPYRKLDRLVLQSVGQSRDWVEKALFAEGWRRHPGGMNVHEYPQWSGHEVPALTFYSRARGVSKDSLLARGGADIDAVIARYALAATYVRPSDTVLVDGAYAADGATIITALSQAANCKADRKLSGIADRSLDLVVAMSPTTPGGWQAQLDAYARVLKFDGRLILVIRRAEKAGDPLPANWSELNEALSSRFLVERRFEQGALTQDPMGPRGLMPAALDKEANGPWLFTLVSANPLGGADTAKAFNHPDFTGRETPLVADFGAAYDNPWLYRTMVQMGERLGNEGTLARLAEYVIGNARMGSADQGAALTVFGYHVLAQRDGGAVAGLLEAIQGYAIAAGESPSPHVARWKISLSFLAGRLCELIGDREAALRWYRATSEADWQVFSPILATKAVGAAFYEARLYIAAGDHAEARAALQRGVDISLRAAACPHRDHMGDPERPLGFYLTELAEVIDMGSQCAGALSKFHLLDRDPGLFWRQVDVRRFGLATWNTDLERENRQLRTTLAQKRA